MTVRRLTAADALAFRHVRLEALRLHPDAYGSTLTQWEALPESRYIQRLENGVVFGLWTEKGLEGLLAYDREDGHNARHRASLHAVYVRKRLRGKGAVDLLIEAAIAQGRADGLAQIELSVAETNTRAYDAYARHGFVRFGVIPRALLVKGRYVDEIQLIRRLDD